jgi:hypothetical protein
VRIKTTALAAMALAPLTIAPAACAGGDNRLAYVTALAAGAVATTNCPGASINDAELARLGNRLLSTDELVSPDLQRDAMQMANVGLARIQIDGAVAWCANVKSLFGPNGSLVPHLIDFRAQ